jgi:uncharacterized membrane protein YoaK (UPF0700 family)
MAKSGTSAFERPEQRRLLAVALAAVAGFVDAAGYSSLNLFTAHMSGNSARIGVYLGHGLLLRAVPSAFAVAVFVLAVGLGTWIMERSWRARWRSPAAGVLTSEALLLAAFAGFGALVARQGRIPSGAGVYYPLAALPVIAMGLQTSALQRISRRTVRTTFVTGMLTQLADEVVGQLSRSRDPGRSQPGDDSYLRAELGIDPGVASLRRIRLIAAIWCSYAAGAVLGGYLHHRWHLLAVAVPVGALIAVIVIELRWPSEAPAPPADS